MTQQLCWWLIHFQALVLEASLQHLSIIHMDFTWFTSTSSGSLPPACTLTKPHRITVYLFVFYFFYPLRFLECFSSSYILQVIGGLFHRGSGKLYLVFLRGLWCVVSWNQTVGSPKSSVFVSELNGGGGGRNVKGKKREGRKGNQNLDCFSKANVKAGFFGVVYLQFLLKELW